MNRCTSELLESFMLDYGWAFRREGEGLWKTAFRSDGQTFPLSIIMTENIISFVIQPFVDADIDWEDGSEVSRRLLECNARIAMAKFSLSEEGRIELSLDVLNGAFNYDSFLLATGLLGHYADTYYDEILSDLDLVRSRYCESFNLLT
jgi:hypothetical protein